MGREIAMSGHSTLLHICIAPPKSYPGFVAPELFPRENFFCLPVYWKTSKGVMATLRPIPKRAAMRTYQFLS